MGTVLETHRTLIDDLLEEQAALPAVEKFAQWHDRHAEKSGQYSQLLPTGKPSIGQQYAFEVNLDSCTGCKACVVACHSLNGLSADESWRSVGTMVSTDWRKPQRQTITTACHHCVDPACANGCPTLAYEKDAETGIVRHLDDQCMGCGYCAMTCPYEVPQYEPRLGVVRKCDMCRQRLDEGEAPACVQSCPNGAIRIVLVDKAELLSETRNTALLPTAPSSAITSPSTRYVSSREEMPLIPEPEPLKLQPAHWPLVGMLLLSQWGVGAVTLAWWMASLPLAIMGAVLGMLGTASAVLHLGRPFQSWRAWLGWRKSWLSREILSFGMHGSLAPLLAVALWGWPEFSFIGAVAAATGWVGVVSSGMLYHVTHRAWWKGERSVGRFTLTACLLGAASACLWEREQSYAVFAALLALVKMAAEARWLRVEKPALADEAHDLSHSDEWSLAKSLQLVCLHLAVFNRLRFIGYLAGAGLLLAGHAVAGLTLLAAAELMERVIYFRAAVAPTMPGWRPRAAH